MSHLWIFRASRAHGLLQVLYNTQWLHNWKVKGRGFKYPWFTLQSVQVNAHYLNSNVNRLSFYYIKRVIMFGLYSRDGEHPAHRLHKVHIIILSGPAKGTTVRTENAINLQQANFTVDNSVRPKNKCYKYINDHWQKKSSPSLLCSIIYKW